MSDPFIESVQRTDVFTHIPLVCAYARHTIARNVHTNPLYEVVKRLSSYVVRGYKMWLCEPATSYATHARRALFYNRSKSQLKYYTFICKEAIWQCYNTRVNARDCVVHIGAQSRIFFLLSVSNSPHFCTRDSDLGWRKL